MASAQPDSVASSAPAPGSAADAPPSPLTASPADWRPALVAAVLALVVYAVSLNGTYIYDDLTIAHDDARLHDVHRWVEYLTKPYFPGTVDRLWRPLVCLSYAVQWELHGDRPWVFHLVNILLHAGVCAVVAELARRLTQGNSRVAFVAGMLFAAHPIHVEAVAGIVGRAEVACALGTLGALTLFARRPLTGRRAIAIAACVVAAILSKEQGVLAPLMLLMWGVLRSARRPSEQEGQATRWLTILLALLLCTYIIYRGVFYENELWFTIDTRFIDWVMNPMVRAEGIHRWLMPIAMLGRYLALLIAPIKLSPDYGTTVIGWTVSAADPYLYLGFAAVAGWIVCFIWSLRSPTRPVVAFCLLCAGLTWGLVSNLVSLVGINFAERLMYLPSAFFVILVAVGVAHFRERRFVPVLAIVLILFSLRTVSYAQRWNDRLEFYRISFKEQPRSSQLLILLMNEHVERHEYADAERYAQMLRQMLPEHWYTWEASAVVAQKRHDSRTAQAYRSRAHELRERFIRQQVTPDH